MKWFVILEKLNFGRKVISGFTGEVLAKSKRQGT